MESVGRPSGDKEEKYPPPFRKRIKSVTNIALSGWKLLTKFLVLR